VPDVAADGVTDDRAAIQRALDAAPGDRPWTVWLPGLCYIGAGGTSAGAPFGLVIRKSGVTLTGSKGAGLISNEIGIRLLQITGIPGTPDNPVDPDAWITSAPVLPFADDVPEGTTTVVLRNAKDAAALRPGDTVFLRTGQLTGSTLRREPDAELNEVRAVSGSDITLTYPTAKPYIRERLPSDGRGPSSPGASGRSCPWGLSRATRGVIRDVAITGLRLIARNTGGPSTALAVQQAWGVTVQDCSLVFGKYGVAARYVRDVRISRTNLFTVGASSDHDPVWLAPATGCTDWLGESCRGGGTVPAKLHAHEGVADLRVVDWQSRTPDGPGQSGAENVSIRGRAYRQQYEIHMVGSYTSKDTCMVRVSSEVTGPAQQVEFRELNLGGSPGLAFISVETPAVTILKEGLDLPAGAHIQLLNGARPFV